MFAQRRNNIYYAFCILFLEIATVFCSTKSASENAVNNIDDNNQFENKFHEGDFQLLREKRDLDTVEVKLYYATHCQYCRKFMYKKLAPIIRELKPYLELYTYPLVEMIKAEDGNTTFVCQHGDNDCYGTKLHACALAALRGHKFKAVMFNICMMKPQFKEGSNDEAADECGGKMSIDVKPIKKCAKGDEGIELLDHYGEETEKADFDYVPYVLVNGRVVRWQNLLHNLCLKLRSPTPICNW